MMKIYKKLLFCFEEIDIQILHREIRCLFDKNKVCQLVNNRIPSHAYLMYYVLSMPMT